MNLNHTLQVSAKGMDDDTPLHDACINGHMQVAELLISHGADVVREERFLHPDNPPFFQNQANKNGRRPLDVASGPEMEV